MIELLGFYFELVCSKVKDLSADVFRGCHHRWTGKRRCAATRLAHGIRRHVRIAAGELDLVQRNAERFGAMIAIVDFTPVPISVTPTNTCAVPSSLIRIVAAPSPGRNG